MTRPDVSFREVQPWHRNHLLRVLMPMESVIVTLVLFAAARHAPPRDQWIIAATWLALGVLLPAGFLWWRLVTEVGPDRLHARFAGLPGWTISLERVESAEVVKVEPMRDFGGWGWRFSRRHGQVFNVWGNHAVVITTVDGRRRTLGTQRPEELAAAILSGAMGEPGGIAGFHSDSGTSKA